MSLSETRCARLLRAAIPTMIAHALALMTRSRVRYLLAVRDGRALGLVSIGDLVKARLESAELESRVLRDMALGAVLARP